MKLDEQSSYLTTFWTPFGRFRWLWMPFGVSTAPEEFQRWLHEVFEGLPGVEVIADDILVYGSGDTIEQAVQDHDGNLTAVLERARRRGLRLNKQKLKLRRTEVAYMGHLLTSKGLRPDPRKIQAVSEMPIPDGVQAVQRLLGFVNYLAKFLPHLSEVCEPLRRLTDKGAIWCWQPQHDKAVEVIKKLVTNYPVLRYYDVNEPVVIQCDASEVGLGAALLQNGQPVAYASRSLTTTDRRYAQIEKECLAILFACERFDLYVYGRERVFVESDHKPLEVIFKKPLLSAPRRLQRMLLKLQKYNLDIRYKKGKEMYLADTLSRASLSQTENGSSKMKTEQIFHVSQQTKAEKEVEGVNQTSFLKVTADRLKQIQQHTAQDMVLQILKTTVLTGWPETRQEVPIAIREFWCFREELTVQNGVIFKGERIVIPKAMRPEMLKRIHSSHLGGESCLRKARDVLYWPNMSYEIKDMVGQCTTCNEHQRTQTKEPLMTHPIPERPWSRVAIDIFTLHGEDYLLTVDFYSDFWEVDRLNDMTAATVIELCKMHFSRYGVPDVVVSDNGRQFDSREFTEFAKSWEFEHTTSSPYHSQSNGKVEAAVKIVKNLLKKAKRSGQDVWKAVLDWRNTPTENMKSSPVQRLMSRRTRTLLPTVSQLLKPKVEGVQEKIKLKRQKSKQYYDKGAVSLPELRVGEKVRVQPTVVKKDRRWEFGTCVRKSDPRSYVVRVGDKLLRRNRKFIRTTKERGLEQNVPEEVQDPQSSCVPEEVQEPQLGSGDVPVNASSESLSKERGEQKTPSNVRSRQKDPMKSVISDRSSLVNERTIDNQSSKDKTVKSPKNKVAMPVVRQTRTRKIRQPERYGDYVMS